VFADEVVVLAYFVTVGWARPIRHFTSRSCLTISKAASKLKGSFVTYLYPFWFQGAAGSSFSYYYSSVAALGSLALLAFSIEVRLTKSLFIV